MNKTQESIILSIMDWAKTNRDPIPRKEIIERMRVKNVPESTVKASITVLIKKGWIRKAITVRHEATYVLLGTVAQPVIYLSASPSYEDH